MTEYDARGISQRWLSTREAAQYLGLSPSTLNNDRTTRLIGLPFSRMGRRILYDRLALDDFLLSKMEGTNCEMPRREDA
ncbi:helix-turn-helix domain-containing protein [uncultured Desulfovibrio sp.]|uniref:helix-turn-helix domain-containing protein n=1 Tax=uncultured Desulfovibrio sp. TaxID=167968 RepID=UPI00262E486C|nr:helix-turn-helix domain-containing protein [uncultured Desulfovibrio sp.]